MKGFMRVVAFVAMVTGCAHPQIASPTCPRCEATGRVGETAELERENGRLHKEKVACSENLTACQDANAYMVRWRETFGAMKKLIEGKLSPMEAVDEDGEPLRSVGKEDDTEELEYTIGFLNGTLVLTFANDVFFNRGKPALTPSGKRVIEGLAEAFKEIEGHKVTIGCRSTAAQENENHAKWLAVRELSAKRAVAIMAEMEKQGVEPRSLVAASLSNKVEEDAMERGTTAFIIAPSPRELPKYPDAP